MGSSVEVMASVGDVTRRWEELDLETAMDMLADRVWQSREETFVEKEGDSTLMHTLAVCHHGGATLDIEENYLIRKLFASGLGMNCIRRHEGRSQGNTSFRS